jgi:hypothetical protein
MPLSDDEQRWLDTIEQSLHDDPKFVARATIDGLRRRRVLLVGALLILGLALVVTGLVATQIQVAVGVITCIAGLLTMAAALFIGLHGRPW